MTGLELKKRLHRRFSFDDSLISEKLENKEKYKRITRDNHEVTVSELELVAKRLNLPINSLLEKVEEPVGDILVDEPPHRLPLYQWDINFPMKENERLVYFCAVFIDECSEVKTYTPQNIRDFSNSEKGDYVYFLFRDNKTCEIRHVNKNKDINIEFIGEDGYRIFVESGMYFQIKLFQNNDCKWTTPVKLLEDFGNGIVKAFDKYFEEIKE